MQVPASPCVSAQGQWYQYALAGTRKSGEWHSKTDFGASDLLSRGYRGCGEETLINCVEKSLEQM